MGKVVVSMLISLDGVIQEPMWTFPYWGDDLAVFKRAELFGSDALLLGRVTYKAFAEAWTSREDAEGYADRINSMPKYVVSTSLENPTWANTSIIKSNIADEVGKLRAGDQNLLVFGSGRLVDFLIYHDLVDQYNLIIYPLVLGKGQRLFEEETETKLKLVESQPFNSGAIKVIYTRDRT